MNDTPYDEGVVTILPDDPVTVNQTGKWTLTFTAGESGLELGSTLRIDVPRGFTPPQIGNPHAPGYVQITSKTTQAEFAIAIGRLPDDGPATLTADTGLFLIRIDRQPDRTVQGVLGQGIIAGFSGGSNSRFGVGRDARRAEAGRGYPAGRFAQSAERATENQSEAVQRESQSEVRQLQTQERGLERELQQTQQDIRSDRSSHRLWPQHRTG